jgi:hypothetical protein
MWRVYKNARDWRGASESRVARLRGLKLSPGVCARVQVQASPPGKFVRRVLCLRRAPIEPPGDGIALVPLGPTSLLPTGGLTFRLSASRLRNLLPGHPVGTTGGRSCMVSSGFWHRDNSSSSSRSLGGRACHDAWVTLRRVRGAVLQSAEEQLAICAQQASVRPHERMLLGLVCHVLHKVGGMLGLAGLE